MRAYTMFNVNSAKRKARTKRKLEREQRAATEAKQRFVERVMNAALVRIRRDAPESKLGRFAMLAQRARRGG